MAKSENLSREKVFYALQLQILIFFIKQVTKKY